MIALKKIVMAGVVLGSLGMSAASYAGDCKQVKFQFTNNVVYANEAVDIKIKKIAASGNDGSWTENISNKVVGGNKSYTTDKRRLNKLDSGKRGDFVVHYERRKLGPGWTSVTQAFNNKKCWDGKTFTFTLNNS